MSGFEEYWKGQNQTRLREAASAAWRHQQKRIDEQKQELATYKKALERVTGERQLAHECREIIEQQQAKIVILEAKILDQARQFLATTREIQDALFSSSKGVTKGG